MGRVLEPWPSPWVVPLKEGSAEGPGSGRISGQLRGPEHLCSSLQGKEGLSIEGSMLMRLLRCFLDAKSFGLTLRLWDVLILEGNRLLTAMAHASFKIHRKRLMKLSWSTIWEFQERLSQSWALEDNTVLRNLQASMKELTKKHWDLPPPGSLLQNAHCYTIAWGLQSNPGKDSCTSRASGDFHAHPSQKAVLNPGCHLPAQKRRNKGQPAADQSQKEMKYCSLWHREILLISVC
ncbi:PREDICTED: TBC1 domain family member 3B-like [Mandrillus leucophaeus]|uniref:TBC1 domain family member 3B-like n=1 Tax=Mandrillus leucophaeus TaxID=9568 RepID=UPI0005F3C202|nr:PREDICTED: TBC1 domain family member 3B-like [Mandrillus leucophaeus]